MDYIVCHYHEIGIKGKNKNFFERKLLENIRAKIRPENFQWIKRLPGRIVIKLSENGKNKIEDVQKSLLSVFGISYFGIAVSCPPKIEEIAKTALKILKQNKGKTFKIETKRSDKKFPLTSPQVNNLVGQYIIKNLKEKKVKLKNPKITCFIEILENIVFIYVEKIKGMGGLPTTTAGNLISLISGGIDSPVASFLMQKRGAHLIFVHFHAYPYTSNASIEKVKKIVEILNQYQLYSKLYLLPLGEIQKEILLKTKPKYRVLLYRRMMLKIAQVLAKKEKAQGIVTGESLGQVASQTLENIKVIENGIDLPIFRPLIGMDKEEIIQMAKKIGTYQISILPHQDCCARFLPKHPATKADLEKIKKEEAKIDLENLIKSSIANAQIIKF